LSLLPLVSWGRDSGTGGIVDYRVGAARDLRVGAADSHRMRAVEGFCAGADSEAGRLRTALVHRPGPELRRLTPRNSRWLGFADPPWVARAQQEHDAFTDLLRDHGVEVLYLSALLADVLEYGSARAEAIDSVLADPDLGTDLRASVGAHLERLPPQDLAAVLIAGLTAAELGGGRGLVYDLLDPQDFVIEPLPGLVFSRDASAWIGDQAVVANLPGARRREGALLATIYRHHPEFTGLRQPYEAAPDQLHGGDILLLAPGVVAVGVGSQTTPAAAERLASHLLIAEIAHTVLVVPLPRHGSPAQWAQRTSGVAELGTACTVADAGTLVMAPAMAFGLTAFTMTASRGSLAVGRPRPFLEAAARSMALDRLRVIDTGVDPAAGTTSQWDDAANALALGRGVVVCEERNADTSARLRAAGLTVVMVPLTELGNARGGSDSNGRRGGPRCMCAPILRDPVAAMADPGPDRANRDVPAARVRPAHEVEPEPGELAPLG